MATSVVTRQMAKSGEAVMSGSQDEASNSESTFENRIKERMLELESLKLQVELERLKLSQMQSVDRESMTSSRADGERSRMGEYARELRAVLTPMPDSDPLVPAWFKNVDVVFGTLCIPEEFRGALILPFLNEKMRAFSASQCTTTIISYRELKESILKELKMTSNEYKRLFYTARKNENESWNQFATKLETLYTYYVNSRKVESLDDLKQLTISDRLKQVMPDDVRGYVIQNEVKEWLKPKDIAQLAENYEESRNRNKHFPRKGNGASKSETQNKRELEKPPTHFRNEEAGHHDKHNYVRWGRYGRFHRNERRNEKSGAIRTENEDSTIPKLIGKVSNGVNNGLTKRDNAKLVKVMNGNCMLNARIDSGADITVLRGSKLQPGIDDPSRGRVKLEGAFGHVIDADLAYVTLSLQSEDNKGQGIPTLCAITDALTEGVDALITPEAYETLERTLTKEVDYDSEDVEIATAMTEEMQGGMRSTSLEFEFEDEECVTGNVNFIALPQEEEVNNNTFSTEQKEDATLKEAWDQAQLGTHGMLVENGLLFHKEEVDGRSCKQLVLPENRRKEVLRLAHDSACAGHFSQKRTKQRIKASFFWPSLASDVKKYCQSCQTCQMFSKRQTTDRVPIVPLARPNKPFEVIFIDCIGPLDPPSSRGHRYALSIVDLCTRWTEVVLLRTLTAKATCQALLDTFSRFGIPDLICCDQGSNFTSKLTDELLAKIGIKIRFSTPEHPQSNGTVERWNGTFKAMLKHIIHSHNRDWDRYVPCLLWAYREIPHEVTGVSPFELMYGRAPQGPLHILRKSWTGEWTPPLSLNKSAVEYLIQLRRVMAETSEIVNKRVEAAQNAYANRYNLRAREKSFNVDDEVLILNTSEGRKMRPNWAGPAKVIEKKRENSYIVQVPGENPKWVHANNLRPYIARAHHVGVIFDADRKFGEIPHVPMNRLNSSLGPEFPGVMNANDPSDIFQILQEFRDVFSETPGRCKTGEHKITLIPGAKPTRRYNYKVPLLLREEVERQVEQLLEWDFIYPTESAFSHPVVCVSKKDGSMRMCVDYRQLNEITEADNFPMQNVNELLYDVAKANFISVLDMTRGYWQVPLHPDSRKLTAFSTPRGLYAWKVMPYGLKNSAATFQRVINEVLKPHRGYACAYIDDVAIYSQSWDEHLNHIRAVLESIRDVGLVINAKKCKFAQREIKYLGHIVGSGVHSPDPERVKAIKELAAPKTKKELRSALGLFNYYREYVPSYSEIILPLTKLTGRRVPNAIPWNEEAQHAFDFVKRILATIPYLLALDPTKEFHLFTDASEFAIGACLCQEVEGRDRPIAFLSKKLTPSEAKWSTIEREAFAVVWALGRLETWLFGGKIKVLTDHNPLVYLSSTPSSSARLTRWALALQKFNLVFEHVKGTMNVCADALSRLRNMYDTDSVEGSPL